MLCADTAENTQHRHVWIHNWSLQAFSAVGVWRFLGAIDSFTLTPFEKYWVICINVGTFASVNFAQDVFVFISVTSTTVVVLVVVVVLLLLLSISTAAVPKDPLEHLWELTLEG